MAEYDFDLFTIGAGSGGVAASRRAGSYGARVAICEESRVGGTCVIRGCVPKKLLMYGSHYRDDFDDSLGFGWSASESKLDWGRLVAAKNREIDRLNDVYIRLLRDSGVTQINGHGTLVDAHTVRVGDRTYTARNILIATGGRPWLPNIPGIDQAITSNEALELEKLPKSIVIVGGGYIAAEFAGIFHASGVKVTLAIRGDTLLRDFDDDVRATLTSELRKKGIQIRTETFIRDIERCAAGLNLMTAMGEIIEAECVMFATGRTPNTESLNLQSVGVKVGDGGAVLVDPKSQTSIENIFAIGDCTDQLNLTPVAISQGRALAESLFNNRPMTVDLEFVPSAVFSQPPAASVGYTEHGARAKFGAVDVYVTNFRAMKHTLSHRDERTMMKLVVDRASQRVVGCHMVGADAAEVIQGFAVALRCGATKAQFDTTVGVHPSAAEEFVTMRDKRPDRTKDVRN